MNFYLSSFRLGGKAADLQDLASGRKLGLIPNAVDCVEPEARERINAVSLAEVSDLGIDVEFLDLKMYLGAKDDLRAKLADLGGVWVRGGNTFVLRQAMALCGFDEALIEVADDDFLYGGYSAGVCVLAPSLDGLQHVDEPILGPYPKAALIWEGLGILDYLILPHYKSDHPESADVDREVEYCTENGIPFKTLRDCVFRAIGPTDSEGRGPPVPGEVAQRFQGKWPTYSEG